MSREVRGGDVSSWPRSAGGGGGRKGFREAAALTRVCGWESGGAGSAGVTSGGGNAAADTQRG